MLAALTWEAKAERQHGWGCTQSSSGSQGRILFSEKVETSERMAWASPAGVAAALFQQKENLTAAILSPVYRVVGNSGGGKLLSSDTL